MTMKSTWPHISPDEAAILVEQQKLKISRKPFTADHENGQTEGDEVEIESQLRKQVVDWAKNKGYPILWFPQTEKVKQFLPPGWPDCILIIKEKILFFEGKKKKGRKSEDQKRMDIWFGSLGHKIYEIKSFRKFLRIVEKEKLL